MIGIYLPAKSGYLDLPADLTFSLTIPSPLYFGGDMTVIPGGYSLPMNISARNDNNRRLLGYPDFLNIKTFVRSYDVLLFLDGNYYDTGTLYVKMASPSQYQVQVFFGPGHLNYLKEKSLKDYFKNLPSMIVSDWPAFLAIYNNINQAEHQFFPFEYFPNGIEGAHETSYAGGTYVWYLIFKILQLGEGYRVTDQVFFNTELKHLFIIGDRRHRYNYNQFINELINKWDWVPNMTVAEFLKNLRKNFCIAYVFDIKRKKVSITEMGAVLQGAVKDWTERLRSPLEINYEEIIEVASLSFKDQDDLEDFASISLKLEGDKIESTLPPLGMYEAVSLGTLLPKSSGTFNFGNDLTWVEQPLPITDSGTLLIYRGQQTGAAGPYAYCTWDSKDPDGDPLPAATQTLHWDGDQGFYNHRWKAWLDFLDSTVEVSGDFLLRWEDIFEPNDLFLSRIRLWDEHGGGWQTFLLKELKIVIHNTKGIQLAQQTLVQIRP